MDCQGIFSVIPSPEYNLNRMPFCQVFEIWCSRETGSYYRSCLYVSLLTISTMHLQFLIWKYVQCQEKSSSVCSIQPHLFTIIGFFFNLTSLTCWNTVNMEIQLEVIHTGFTHGILFIDLDILKSFGVWKTWKKSTKLAIGERILWHISGFRWPSFLNRG